MWSPWCPVPVSVRSVLEVDCECGLWPLCGCMKSTEPEPWWPVGLPNCASSSSWPNAGGCAYSPRDRSWSHAWPKREKRSPGVVRNTSRKMSTTLSASQAKHATESQNMAAARPTYAFGG